VSWNDFYRRRDIIDSVLRAAARDPGAPIALDGIPGARDTFGGEEGLLLALHYKWTLLFGGHLDAELLDDSDHVVATVRAWRAAVRANPPLRAVLDVNLGRYPSLRSAHEEEQRKLAVAAGFAGPYEPTEEITRAGAAIEALARQSPPARQVRDQVAKRLRMLAPSG
jgi:hypothetical protein